MAKPRNFRYISSLFTLHPIIHIVQVFHLKCFGMTFSFGTIFILHKLQQVLRNFMTIKSQALHL